MFLTLLAILQLHSTWAYSHSSLVEAMNDAIHKLKASINSSHQHLQVRDVKIKVQKVERKIPEYKKHNNLTCVDYYYYAFILYEIVNIE